MTAERDIQNSLRECVQFVAHPFEFPIPNLETLRQQLSALPEREPLTYLLGTRTVALDYSQSRRWWLRMRDVHVPVAVAYKETGRLDGIREDQVGRNPRRPKVQAPAL